MKIKTLDEVKPVAGVLDDGPMAFAPVFTCAVTLRITFKHEGQFRAWLRLNMILSLHHPNPEWN